jgi:hypothetical protein
MCIEYAETMRETDARFEEVYGGLKLFMGLRWFEIV